MTSQINPNNIDGSYPVAGQQNNTQGFRDNFTNTKTNFQYAADEITDLQTKAVLKSALNGTTLDNNMNDNILYAVQLKDVSWTELRQAATSGSITLNYAAGNYQAVPSVTGNISLAFSNWPAAGTVGSLKFAIVVSDVSYTLTLPAAVSVGITNVNGLNTGTNVITFPAVGTYVYEFETADGGTTISIQNTIQPTATLSNIVTISNTTPSTNTSTGALVVAGGVGVGGNVFAGGKFSATGNVYTSGYLLLSDSGTLGYNTGAGGTASQSGGKSGGVTLSKPSGQITMASGSLGAGANVSFTLTNTTISSTDVMIINHVSGGTIGAYQFFPSCGSGSATITVVNRTAGSLNEQPVIRFVVIKGSTS